MVAPVVTPEFVAGRLDSLVLVDLRWYLDGRSGHDAYLVGHLPGAVFIDLAELASAPGPAVGRHPLPSVEQFAEAMARHGISDDSETVVYDDQGGVIAARLVWTLRVVGCSSALLDGGIGAWHGVLESSEAAPQPGTFRTRELPADCLADIDEVARTGALLVDVWDPSRFRGEGDLIDPRTGHIPGAESLPCRDNLDAEGRFLPAQQLLERFSVLGIDGDTDVISYCGSGVTACHNLIAFELVGLGNKRLFPGSWSQWASDPSRPIATGPGAAGAAAT